MNSTKSAKICEKGSGGGLFLPLGGDDEQEWHDALRIPLYGLGLAWCFLAVGMASDRFMEAIEKVTAKKKRKYNVKLNRWCTVEVWNPTVANLTLMALGSSAPEILLSVIELLSNEFYSGDLGPSTIVGSAAFNLLCIIAVCVSAIPDGEFRRIKEMPVYVVTAIFSVFAYLWMLVILMGTSENVVEPWEGILTFFFFPVLVLLAYAADRGYLTGGSSVRMGQAVVLSSDMSKEELAELDRNIRKTYGQDLSAEQVSKIALIENQRITRASRRVEATRALTAQKKPRGSSKDIDAVLSDKVAAYKSQKSDTRKVIPEDLEVGAPKTIIEFQAPSYAVLENAGKPNFTVIRHGIFDTRCSIHYATREGSAKAVEDYIHVEGVITFEPGEETKDICVEVVDNVNFEDDEDFFIDLFDAQVLNGAPGDQIAIGETQATRVVIIDDDLPGMLSFPKDTLTLAEELEDWEVDVVVERKNGCTGKITCKYKTESSSALPGLDYEDIHDTLVFENREKAAKIKLKLKARGRYDRTETFRIVLSDVTGGAKFDQNTDGGDENNILTVIIEPQQMAKDRVDRLMSALATNWDKAKVGHQNWLDQFKNAVSVTGGDDDDDDDADEGDEPSKPSCYDWFMHIVMLPWKLLFAFVPPVDYCGGWVCFFSSLLAIGLVTAIINDMASLFGCVLTLGPEVTAITFVALGTSLPDTFASMKAAKEDRTADASIGNVTGSNSVNVFLGLGLPWAMGAIYWRSGEPSARWKGLYANDLEVPAAFRTGSFVVKAGSLAFSVIVFSGCAATCIVVLLLRRRFCQGELGGPKPAKYATSAFLVFLWLLYVGLSSWKSLSMQT